MTANISRATTATELASNPNSFFNCPDLHGGVPGLPGGRSRSRGIRLLAVASKYRALQSSKRLRNTTITGEEALLSRRPDFTPCLVRSNFIDG